MTPPTGRRYPDVSARARVLAVLRVAEGPLETGELTRRCGLPVARPSQRVYAELRILEAAGRVARLRRTLGGRRGAGRPGWRWVLADSAAAGCASCERGA